MVTRRGMKAGEIMGDESRVICQNCSTSYDKKFVLGKQGNVDTCPMCGASLESENGNEESAHEESPSFGEDVDNPDLYFYDIESEDEYENEDLRDIWCQCTSCKKVNTIAYNLFDSVSQECLILKKGLDLKCKGCGKPFTNIVVPQRPKGWREINHWEKDYEHLPKCPTCNSTNIKKISVTSKAASVAMWGLLSRKVHKQWHCNICGSEW